MSSRYLTATPQEWEQWIQAYIDRRKYEWDRRLPRYNGKGKGRAPRGTISIDSSLRKMARNHWHNRLKRALTREQERQAMAALSKETLYFIQSLINQLKLNVNAEDFEDTARNVMKAKNEVAAAINHIEAPQDLAEASEQGHEATA